MSDRIRWSRRALEGLSEVISLATAAADLDREDYPDGHPIWATLEVLMRYEHRELVRELRLAREALTQPGEVAK